MSDFDPTQFTGLNPAELAAMVKGTSKDQLTELMAGEHRGKILDGVFANMPGEFRADRAGNTNAVIHWNIGRADGGVDTYEVVIADGTCTTTSTPVEEPKVAVTLSGPDFLQLIAGSANPMMMFMTGKLKAKGDLGLAANLANFFNVPKS